MTIQFVIGVSIILMIMAQRDYHIGNRLLLLLLLLLMLLHWFLSFIYECLEVKRNKLLHCIAIV